MGNLVCNIFNKENNYLIREKGYIPIRERWDDVVDLKRYKKEKKKEFLDKSIIDLFERFIRECQESQIKVILVYSPEYIEHQQLITNLAEVMNVYKSFADKYNLTFLNYSNVEMCLDKVYFSDSLHLNDNGADAFTYKLVLDLKKIGLG